MGSPLFGYLSGLLAFLFYLGIIRSILIRETRPSRATWIIWAANDLLILAGSYVAGAQNTLWVPLVYSVCGLFCAAASINNDTKPLSTLDKSCLSTSVVAWGILLWMRNQAQISLILGVLVNTLGAFPTVGKLLKNPDSERIGPWLIVFAGSVCQLIALEQWRFELLLFPVDSILINGAVLTLILRGRHTGRKGKGP